MLLVDDLAAGGTKNLRHTPRGLVTLILIYLTFSVVKYLTYLHVALQIICSYYSYIVKTKKVLPVLLATCRFR